MNSRTVRARLSQLLRKSQKAVHLYSVRGISEEKRFSAVQLKIWKQISSDLTSALEDALRKQPTRHAVKASQVYRDKLYADWRKFQSELFIKREQLLDAATEDQYARAALLSENLLSVKASMQATRAAMHELEVALGDVAYDENDGPHADTKDAGESDLDNPDFENGGNVFSFANRKRK